MRTWTGFLAVVGAFVGEFTLAQPTTPHVNTRRHHLPERTYRPRHLDDSNCLSAERYAGGRDGFRSILA